MKYTLIFLLFITSLSCTLSTSENHQKAKPDYKKNLSSYLSKNYNKLKENSTIQNITLKNVNWMNEVYKTIKYNSIWMDDSLELNKDANKFLGLLCSAYNFGLDTSYYYGDSLKILAKNLSNIPNKKERYSFAADLDVLLTNSYFLFAKDLNYGMIPFDSTQLVTGIPRKEFTVNLPQHLVNSFKKDSVVAHLLNLQPRQLEYIKLQKQLSEYLKTASLSKESIKVEQFRIDSVKSYEQSKKALILHRYLTENSNDSSYFEALKLFQVRHGLSPDGLIGNNTARALSKSPYEDYKKAILSLEKWRWKKDWGADYIFVNIPSYQLKAYQKNKLKKALNVVVGKRSTPTAEINDEMEYLIVFPFWNLPYSISTKELLPKIRKDSTYLTRNGYKVFTANHQSVNSNEVDWANLSEDNFNYKIRQNGGRTNSLGLIKFIFPNKNSIYIHDTPSKRYFKNEIRAYSHGCIRVQHPFGLADLILSSDSNNYNIDSVHVFIENRKQKKITLNKKIPVYIEYFTCGTDTNNNIVFYKDIYGLDGKLDTLMQQYRHSIPAKVPQLVSR